MIILKTKFKDLKVVKSKKFKDPRGEFREIFKKKVTKEKKNFIFTCYSRSKKMCSEACIYKYHTHKENM